MHNDPYLKASQNQYCAQGPGRWFYGFNGRGYIKEKRLAIVWLSDSRKRQALRKYATQDPAWVAMHASLTTLRLVGWEITGWPPFEEQNP